MAGLIAHNPESSFYLLLSCYRKKRPQLDRATWVVQGYLRTQTAEPEKLAHIRQGHHEDGRAFTAVTFSREKDLKAVRRHIGRRLRWLG